MTFKLKKLAETHRAFSPVGPDGSLQKVQPRVVLLILWQEQTLDLGLQYHLWRKWYAKESDQPLVLVSSS